MKLLLLIADSYLRNTFTYSLTHALIVTSQSNSWETNPTVYSEAEDHAEAPTVSR